MAQMDVHRRLAQVLRAGAVGWSGRLYRWIVE